MEEAMNATSNGSCFEEPNLNDPYYRLCAAILWSRRAVSVVSMVSSFLVIVLVVLFKKYRVFNQRLILYLSISAFMQPLSYLMSDYEAAANCGLCVFTAFLTQVLDWVSVLWVCCITLTIFMAIVFSKSAKKLEIPYHIVCWGLPLIIGVIPFTIGAYGRAGLWCWIMPEDYGVVLQFLLYYIPLITISVGIIVVSVAMIIILRRRSKTYKGTYNPQQDEQKEMLRKQVQSLYFYPWVFAILFFVPFINRIRLALEGSIENRETSTENMKLPVELSFILWYLHAVTLPFLGTMYAVIFTLDKNTRSQLTWTSIKNAVLCRNTSKVAKPYDIDISVEHGTKEEGDAPDNHVEEDTSVNVVKEDTSGNQVEVDTSCNPVEEDAPGNHVEEDTSSNVVEEDVPSNVADKDAPSNVVEEDTPGNVAEKDAPNNHVEGDTGDVHMDALH